MKKVLLVFVGLLLILVGCSSTQKISNLEKTSESFEVDKEAKTIRHKGDTYYYEIEGNTVRILYPNQGVYWWTNVGNSGYGDWNEHYNSEVYIAGNILVDVVNATKVSRLAHIPIEKIGITGILILLGIMNLFWPRTLWQLWGLDHYIFNAFLSAGLVVIRVVGILMLLAACCIWG